MKTKHPTFMGRAPFVIGTDENPYLLRWFLIPKNKIFNVYLHKFCRSDDDRALHDHPWLFNASFLLRGEYFEHVFKDPKNWQKNLETIRIFRPEGAKKFRFGRAPHRIELMREFTEGGSAAKIKEKPVWTIFITGPRLWDWGFYCPKGWKFWRKYSDVRENGNSVGEGCGE